MSSENEESNLEIVQAPTYGSTDNTESREEAPRQVSCLEENFNVKPSTLAATVLSTAFGAASIIPEYDNKSQVISSAVLGAIIEFSISGKLKNLNCCTCLSGSEREAESGMRSTFGISDTSYGQLNEPPGSDHIKSIVKSGVYSSLSTAIGCAASAAVSSFTDNNVAKNVAGVVVGAAATFGIGYAEKIYKERSSNTENEQSIQR